MKANFLPTLAGAAMLAGQLHAGDLVAHEWGTFTSVQGSDGDLLQWNPLNSSELPTFVYNRSRPLGGPKAALASIDDVKSVFLWTQRLETPVVYFYSTEPTRVSFEVKFPGGLITEWYPQLTAFGPTRNIKNAVPPSDQSFARWDNLQVLGGSRVKTAGVKLPAYGSGNHYYAARETGSQLLRTDTPLTAGTNSEVEKFIFYRGAGNFAAPLRVGLENDGAINLFNQGIEPLRDLFILNVKGQTAKYSHIETLHFRVNTQVPFAVGKGLEPVHEVVPRLSGEVEKSLLDQGLYPDEARAMIKTWSDSWFAEDGLRVLYLLPREWTDQTLPVTITPAPKELVRVMVGRAEVFSRRIEDKLRGIYTESQSPGSMPAAAAKLADLNLGRFTPSALARLEELEKQDVTQQVRALRGLLNSKSLSQSRY